MGACGEATRRRPRRPREPRPDRPHPLGGEPVRRERLLGPRDRPALQGGRHRIVPRRGGGDGCAVRRPHLSLRRRHEVGSHRAQAAPAREEDRRDRLLLRRRDGLDVAHREGVQACRGGAVLWAVPGGLFAEGLEGGRARNLRRARLAREREQARRGCRATRGRGAAPARHFLEPTTPSSTTPARATTARRPRLRTSACSPGSRGTSASPFARRPAGRARTRHPRPRPDVRGAGERRRRRCEAGRR